MLALRRCFDKLSMTHRVSHAEYPALLGLMQNDTLDAALADRAELLGSVVAHTPTSRGSVCEPNNPNFYQQRVKIYGLIVGV